MAIPLDEVKRIAKLAGLRFTNSELERMAGELDTILDYIGTLNELDTSGVEPFSHFHNEREAHREDSESDSVLRRDALRGSRDADDKYFRVPKVIE
jgi:aspartyl-tRNA(Asn)/glutamyl-tRNA(Gln) amidotransferase subunit C